jgi:hypothetical protein
MQYKVRLIPKILTKFPKAQEIKNRKMSGYFCKVCSVNLNVLHMFSCKINDV